MVTLIATPPLPPVQGTTKTNVLAIVSLVTGIVGLLASCVALIPFVGWFSLICVGPCGLAALITGIIGLSQIKKNAEKGKGLAIVGVVLGALSLVFVCLVQLLWPLILTALGPIIGDVFSDINSDLIY